MGFTEKTSQYQVCVKFIETISPKNTRNQTDAVDLKSPTEDQTINNNSDILFVEDTDTRKEGRNQHPVILTTTINCQHPWKISRHRLRGKTKIAAVPQRNSTRNCQSALSIAFGNPVPINAICDKDDKEQKPVRFKIDSPPDKPKTKD